MNKKILITVLTCCIAFNVWSQDVTDSLARVVARNLMIERSGTAPEIVDCNRMISKSNSLYWLVSFTQGWVLVAGSEQNRPIIAYSTKGQYSPELAPLQLLSASKIDNSKLVKKTWLPYVTTSKFKAKRGGVQALLTTQWGQSAPFNQLCPADVDGDDGHAAVGCGATALAQTLNYYQWPTSGYGSSSYVPRDNPQYGTQSVDFTNANYVYPMVTDAQKALISYHTGVAVSMNYGPLGSSSTPNDLARALVRNFKYSPSIRIEARTNYTDEGWKKLIKSELDAKRLVLYSANDSAKSYGHFFIVDGYDDADMFHCNWGWKGKSDGYYDLNSLKPDIYSFNSKDLVIIGIKPQADLVYNSDLAFSKLTLTDSIVVNKSFLASQDAGELLTNSMLFFHFDAKNIGNVDVSDSISLDAYIDDVFVGRYYKAGLQLFGNSWYWDVYFGFRSAGTHVLKLILDKDNKIAELNEDNNIITKQFTIVSAPAAPNICFKTTNYVPNGFYIAKQRDGVSSSTFTELDSLFLNVNIANYGILPIKTSSKLAIYVDNVLNKTLIVDSVPTSRFLNLQNIFVGFLSAGNHSVKLVLDADNQLSEVNEADNVSSITISVVSKANVPNLAFTKLSTWLSSIIVSDAMGTNQHKQSIGVGKKMFVDFAFINNGLTDVKANMSFMVVVDGKDVVFVSTSQAGVGDQLFFRDIELAALPEGSHTIGVRLDCFDAVAEQSESDNYAEMNIRVGNFPDLRFVNDSELMITRSRTSQITQNNITVSDSVFVSAKIENIGTIAVTDAVKTYLLVDDKRVDSVIINGLTAQSQYTILNLKAGKLIEGLHQISIVIDAANSVYEVSEENNSISKSLHIFKTVPIVDLFMYKQGDDSVSINNVNGTKAFKSEFLLGDTLFLAAAVANISNEDLNASFSLKVFVDNVLFHNVTVDTLKRLTYKGFANVALKKLTVGEHLIRFVADADNILGEANENNNVVVRRVVVKDTAPNITYFTPQNWSNAVVVADKKQDYLGSTTFITDSVLYANFAFKNTSLAVNKPFVVQLLLDGVSVKSTNYSALSVDQYYKLEDVLLGKLSEGSHTLSLRIDAASQIAESNEMDNVLDVTIIVSKPIILPAKPSKPQGKAVVCMNESQLLYSTQAVATAQSYVWKIWPTNLATISANGLTANVDLITNASGRAWIKVAAVNASGVGEYSDSLEIFVQAKLSKPKLNTLAKASICEGKSLSLSTNEMYKGTWNTGVTAVSINVQQAGKYWIAVSDENACFTQNSDTVEVVVLAKGSKPVISKGGETTLCDGKSVNLIAPQGDSYKWNTGDVTQTISVANKGKYWVEVKDASGCYAQNSDTVEVSIVAKPIKPSLTAAGSTTLCEGKSVNLTSSVGASYKWNTGDVTQIISVANKGNYWVEVKDASGCYAQNSDTVEVSIVAKPNKPSLTAAGSTVLCEGKSVNLTSSVGASYKWSTGDVTQTISVANKGKYWVEVKDASGCYAQNSDTLVVSVVEKPMRPMLKKESTNMICAYSDISLRVSSGTAFVWNNGAQTQSITPDNPGKYWAVVRDASGCYTQNTDTIIIETIEPLVKPNIVYQNNRLSVTQTSAIVKWFDATTNALCTENSFSFVPQKSGSYLVSLTNVNGCSVMSDPYLYSKTAMTELFEGDLRIITLADKILVFTANATISQLSIVSQLGQTIFAADLLKSEFSSESLPAGVYFVSLVIDNQIFTQRVIIR